MWVLSAMYQRSDDNRDRFDLFKMVVERNGGRDIQTDSSTYTLLACMRIKTTRIRYSQTSSRFLFMLTESQRR
jgi:hypothetical protein